MKNREVSLYFCAMFQAIQNILKPALLAEKRCFLNVLPMFYLQQKRRCNQLIITAFTSLMAVRPGIEPGLF